MCKNSYEFVGDIVYVYADSDKHEDRVLVVDKHNFSKLSGLKVGITKQKCGYSYPHTTIKRKKIKVSKLLFGEKSGLVIDHINGNTFDNTEANIRFVTENENRANRRSVNYRKCAVGGITYFRCQLKLDGICWHIANFKTEAEAIRFGKLINKFKKYHRK